jgi:hypothetical protein
MSDLARAEALWEQGYDEAFIPQDEARESEPDEPVSAAEEDLIAGGYFGALSEARERNAP